MSDMQKEYLEILLFEDKNADADLVDEQLGLSKLNYNLVRARAGSQLQLLAAKSL